MLEQLQDLPAGVMGVRATGTVSRDDYERVIDPLLAVVHAQEFPGWENFGGFLRHMGFVRANQRKVRRVALAADGKLAKLAPAIVETFVGAEVRHFGFDELDRAMQWAGG
ncbi:MAG: STAS/SEC14 domain-containing protein [Gammaproteobacteria bacterium]